MRAPFVLTFAALASASCNKPAPDTTTPPSSTTSAIPTAPPQPTPPATAIRHANPPGLPTWAELTKKDDTVMRTNPPSPFLIVSPQGDCYLKWEGGMTRGGPDRAENCVEVACGKPIVCPEERAAALLTGFEKGKPVIPRANALAIANAAAQKKAKVPELTRVESRLVKGQYVFTWGNIVSVSVDAYSGKVTREVAPVTDAAP